MPYIRRGTPRPDWNSHAALSIVDLQLDLDDVNELPGSTAVVDQTTSAGFGVTLLRLHVACKQCVQHLEL